MSERPPTDAAFDEVVALIASARMRAVQAVNTTLVELYWQVGALISRKIEASEWGEGVVPQLAAYLAHAQPGLRGFTRANLFRMRQFFETYRVHGIVAAVPRQLHSGALGQTSHPAPVASASSPSNPELEASPTVAALLRQLSWTHHVIILGQCKRPEEREFYLRLAIREHWSSRELERQLEGALFERTVLHPPKVSPVVQHTHAEALSVFKDAYLVEFLDLPAAHAESDLHRGLLLKLKDFLIELGRDFCFVGSEFPVQVGGRDFAVDLLFFHRGLNCLVAIELLVVGAATDLYSIVTSSQPLRRSVQVVSGWTAAAGGCKVVGAGGAYVGTAVAPGVGTAVGGFIGCTVGAFIGYVSAERAAGYLFDWTATAVFGKVTGESALPAPAYGGEGGSFGGGGNFGGGGASGTW